MTTEATQTVADLTIAQFRALVREIVVEVVEELIDPDGYPVYPVHPGLSW